MWLLLGLDVLVVVTAIVFYNQFLAVSFDDEFALLRGLRVEAYYLLLLCLTALTVSAGRAKLLAAQLRTIYPDCRILVGGIHASLLPDEFTDVADHDRLRR